MLTIILIIRRLETIMRMLSYNQPIEHAIYLIKELAYGGMIVLEIMLTGRLQMWQTNPAVGTHIVIDFII